MKGVRNDEKYDPEEIRHNVKPFNEVSVRNIDAIRKTLQNDGAVHIKNIFPENLVLAARRVFLKTLESFVEFDKDRGDAYFKPGSRGHLLTGYRPLTHHKDVLSLITSKYLVDIFRDILDGDPATFDTKWARSFTKDEFTDWHSDWYRFASVKGPMYTAWIPLGNYKVDEGVLMVAEKSHLLKDYREEDSMIELPKSFVWFKHQCTKRVSDVRIGDAIIFDIRTIHCSTKNKTDRMRVSIDTRWQLASNLSPEEKSAFQCFSSE